MSEITFRPATTDDINTIIDFTKMLATDEGKPEAVTLSEADLHDLLFSERAIGYCFFAILGGQPVASALLGQKFASYRGKRVLFIEDLVVTKSVRGMGVGNKMMRFLAQKALEMGCEAMEWYALKDNLGALRFYERLGAQYDTPHAILGFNKTALGKVAGMLSE